LQAALAIQDELRQSTPTLRRSAYALSHRCPLGDVIEKSDGTVYGDGVNIAARLQGLAEPGGIVVSDSVRTAVKGKIDASSWTQGEQAVKNIPDPLRAFEVISGSQAPRPSRSVDKASLSSPDSDDSRPEKPSLAVLPFTNLSGDPEQDTSRTGSSTTSFRRFPRVRAFFVIARASSFTYKGRSVAVKQIGRELGVRYVLEGSIRRLGSRVRIVGQLIEAEHDRHIWTERFEGSLDDIFDLQDRITESVAGAIEPSLRLAEIERSALKADSESAGLRLVSPCPYRSISSATKTGDDEALELLPGPSNGPGLFVRQGATRLGVHDAEGSGLGDTYRGHRRAAARGRSTSGSS
jgi:adenylate cyclase